MNRARLLLSSLCIFAACLQFAACGGSSSGGGESDTPGGVTTTSLPDGKVGSPYSATLTATGGTPPYTWTLESGIEGSLPPGLVLSTSGVISGTPTEPGLFGSLAFTATDAKGNSANSGALSINIKALPLIITTTSLPNAVVGQPYASAVTRTGGDPPFTWTIKSGSLPPGLTLQPGGGITGTPTGPGVNPLVFEVTDSDKTVATSANLAINLTLTVATSSLPNANQNAPYTTTLQATGGVPPYTWSGPQGGWPPLLPLSLNASTGVISGTPNIPGPFGQLVFTVQDSTGATASSPNLAIFVKALPLVITTTSLPEGYLQNPYQNPDGTPVALTYTGGDPPINFSIKSGSLPGGLTIPGPCNCSIAGTPNANDPQTTYNFVLQAQDSDGTIATAPLSIQIGSILTLTTTSLPSGTIGTPYYANQQNQTPVTLTAAYGKPPYFFAFQPPQRGNPINTLPANLYLDPSGSGSITGTPLGNGQGPILYLQVTDSLNNVAYAEIPQISLNPQLLVTTTSLPNGYTSNIPYSATLQGQGGTPPYTWSLATGSDPLPQGLVLNGACGGGVICGTPTTNGSYPVTFTLTDSNHVAVNSVPLTITISTKPVLSVLTTSLPGTNDGVPYSATLQAVNGAPPYTWTIHSGTLPAGLNPPDANGVISGTATAAGTALVFQVEDSTHATALSNSMAIQVTSPSCATGEEQLMSNQQPYAFMLKGFDANGPVVIAGSFTTNGVKNGGVVTGGEEDVNRASGYTHSSFVAGSTYTLTQDTTGANPRGCLTLVTSTGTTTYRFVLSGSDGNGHYLTGHIIEFDDPNGTGTRASGIIRRQDKSTFGPAPNGTYAFEFTGSDHNGGHFALAGSMSSNAANYDITDVVADADDAGVLSTDVTGGSGTYENLNGGEDPSGRSTGALIIGANSIYDLPFTYYQVNSNEVIFISSAALSTSPIFGGEALLSTGPFSTGQLTDYFMYHVEGTSNAGGVTTSAATLGVVNFDGLGQYLAGSEYSQDVAGVSTSNIPITGIYALDPVNGASSGRVILDGNINAGNEAVGYIIAPSNLGTTTTPCTTTTVCVFVVGTDRAATSGLMEFQSSNGTVNLAGLNNGQFALGTEENPDNATNNATGEILMIYDTAPPNFAFGGMADEMNAGAGGLAADQSFVGFPYFNANGLGDFGINAPAPGPDSNTTAITNGTEIYYINEDPTITHPVVVRIEP